MLAAFTRTFWNVPPGSTELLIKASLAFIFGIGILLMLLNVPKSARKPIVWGFTFLGGLYWITYWLWPTPVSWKATELPNSGEQMGFLLQAMKPHINTVDQCTSAFLFGLGIYSLLRIHWKQLIKKHRDWFFSLTLLVSMVVMVGFGFSDSIARMGNPLLQDKSQWLFSNKVFNLLFDGLLQQMDAAMFSLIAFFILSAAYRAFRIRSIESTVLMVSALLMVFSLMGAIDFVWTTAVNHMGGTDPNSFVNNFKLMSIYQWVKDSLQVPTIRALNFGLGLGGLAMALRLWLGLEKGGISV